VSDDYWALVALFLEVFKTKNLENTPAEQRAGPKEDHHILKQKVMLFICCKVAALHHEECIGRHC